MAGGRLMCDLRVGWGRVGSVRLRGALFYSASCIRRCCLSNCHAAALQSAADVFHPMAYTLRTGSVRDCLRATQTPQLIG